MNRKLIAIGLTVVLAAVMPAGAVFAEETAEAAEEVTATAVQENQIGGLYLLNLPQTEDIVNLSLIFESDLLAVSQEADTEIYDFHDDGSVSIYNCGQLSESAYTVNDKQLVITGEGEEHTYDYEFVDDLLILHEGEDSSALYQLELNNDIELEDYSTIEVDESLIDFPDDYIDAFIDDRLQEQMKTEEITEGVVEDGDYITISFAGILEGETEPFEGGTGENYTFQLGSGALIDNYEEQLNGKKIGETVDVTVTFPEDYEGSGELKGKTATFTTTINSKTNMIVPELTDEWVQEYSQEYLPETIPTVEEFREYCKNYLKTNALHKAILRSVAGKMKNTEYHNSALAQVILNFVSLNLASMAQSYGVDADTFAQMMGYSSAQKYVEYEASSNIMSALIIDRVLLDLGLFYNHDDFLAQLADDVRMSYGSTRTVEDYIAQTGPVGLWSYTNLQYKYGLAMAALEDRVVLVPHVEEETTAAE